MICLFVGLIGRSTAAIFPRYSELETVQTLIDSIELTHKQSLINHTNNINQTNDNNNENENENENDEDSSDEEESSDRKHTRSDNNNNETDNNESNELSEQQVEVEEEEDDSISQLEITKLLAKKQLQETEDNEFNKAFRNYMIESLENASKNVSNFKLNDIDRMSIPIILPKPKNSILQTDTHHLHHIVRHTDGHTDTHHSDNHHMVGHTDGHNHTSEHTTDSHKPKGVIFKVLGRDLKGKINTHQLLIPENNNFVIKLQKTEKIIKLEKQKIIERVLQIDSLNNSNNLETNNVSYFECVCRLSFD